MSDALTRMRIALRAEGVDQRHAKSLLFWARSFLSFCNNDDLERLDRNDVEAFLTHVSKEHFAGRPARNRALEALDWLFRSLPDGVPAWMKILLEEQRTSATPNVLGREEVRRLLAKLRGESWLAAALIYGTGIRLLECVRLRVRDVDLKNNRLTICDGAGQISRSLALPENIQGPLQEHLEDLKLNHIRDIVEGNGRASLPPLIEAREPRLARNWGWQYLFPQRLERAEGSGETRDRKRVIHHLDPQVLHRKFERAAIDASIYRRVTGHVLRNSFALHMVQQGLPVKQVERMLGTREPGPDDGTTARSLPVPTNTGDGRTSLH